MCVNIIAMLFTTLNYLHLLSLLQPSLPPGASTTGPLGYRYCSTCLVYRPARAKHCRRCQNCVLDFDHHCPYTSNCIGLRNYVFFFRFILAISGQLFLDDDYYYHYYLSRCLAVFLIVVFSISVVVLIQSAQHYQAEHNSSDSHEGDSTHKLVYVSTASFFSLTVYTYIRAL